MNKIPIKVNCDLFYTDEKGKPACEGLNKAYCIYSSRTFKLCIFQDAGESGC